ncbi:MAG: amino acid racemase [Trueperaceae bacterium]
MNDAGTGPADADGTGSGDAGSSDARPVVGVLGGMGPAATWDFCLRLHRATPAKRDQEHLHVRVDCDPSVPDRNAAAAGAGPSPGPHLARMARGLAAAGAELLCMPCNTAHAYADAIRSATSLPFVDMIEATIMDAAEALRRVAPDVAPDVTPGPTPGATRIGLLATTATVRSGLYHRAAEARGLTIVEPDANDQDRVMALVYAVKAGEAGADARAELARLAQRSCSQGAEAIVLGCTELPILIDGAESSGPWAAGAGPPRVGCSDALARAVVRAARAGREPRPAAHRP